jgi:ribosomal protein S18 acetylase RimI-like enzyme
MAIRPAQMGDLQDVAELIAAQNRAAVGVAGIDAELLRVEWEVPGYSLAEDAVVAEEIGRVTGYAAVNLRGGLSLAAPDDAVADELLEPIVARARARGDKTLSFASVPGTVLTRLAERHPFEIETETLVMWRPLGLPVGEPAAPEGITIRTFRPEDAEGVHALLDEAYCGWDPQYVPIRHADWVGWMTGDPEFDADVWWLAERDGALAGCALHWKSGWLKDVAVRDSERGRGLGAALVTTGLAEFARRGVRRVGLKVDAGNPTGAIALYERLGFVTERREAVWSWSL